jgi:hypothetical protein
MVSSSGRIGQTPCLPKLLKDHTTESACKIDIIELCGGNQVLVIRFAPELQIDL